MKKRIVIIYILCWLFTLYPPGDAFGRLVEEWHWSGGTTLTDYKYVQGTPVVVNLTDDDRNSIIDLNDTPDIVFVSNYPLGTPTSVLRAISGDDGHEIFTVTDPLYQCCTWVTCSAGDIDNDGFPEIIALAKDKIHLLAFEHDGTIKWVSDPTTITPEMHGATNIIDIDYDGMPEIIYASEVWDNEGKIKWTGLLGKGKGLISSYSCATNIDSAGYMEVIGGNTVYRHDGTMLWINRAVPDGFVATADFNLDGSVEIVLTDEISGDLWMMNNDGTTRWGPVRIPGSGIYLSCPAIADFNGDTYPEIAIAHHDKLVLFDRNGSIIWIKDVLDMSGAVAPSAFDFDEDGAYEIVYSDEVNLYVMKGTDGSVIESTPLESGTGRENPVIADVDNDGIAEVVVVTMLDIPGVKVFSDQNWPNARKIWNQYNYRITNVWDLGHIPKQEPFHWLLYNNFRAQTGTCTVYNIPSLKNSWILIFMIFCFTSLLTAAILAMNS